MNDFVSTHQAYVKLTAATYFHTNTMSETSTCTPEDILCVCACVCVWGGGGIISALLSTQPGLPSIKVSKAARLRFLRRRRNILFLINVLQYLLIVLGKFLLRSRKILADT